MDVGRNLGVRGRTPCRFLPINELSAGGSEDLVHLVGRHKALVETSATSTVGSFAFLSLTQIPFAHKKATAKGALFYQVACCYTREGYAESKREECTSNSVV